MSEQRFFEPEEYPIEVNIYDAFLKYEMAEYNYLFYGTNPEDWHQDYSTFEAGYSARRKQT